MTAASMTFPRQYARTVGFSLGVPYAFALAPDGGRVAFLRARSGSDRSTGLWLRDIASGAERLVANPEELLSGGEETLPSQERARRERTRQAAAGVVSFAVDEAVHIAAFALSGRLFVAEVADLDDFKVRELMVPGPVLDPVLTRRAPTSDMWRRGRCVLSGPTAPVTGSWLGQKPRT